MSAHRLTETRPTPRTALRRAGAVIAVTATAAALSITSAPLAAAEVVLDKPTLQTATFTTTGSVQSWTVPGNAPVDLMISVTGAQGGRGGFDGGTTPAQGGYVGVVSGTVTVAGGTTLQIAVGAAGGTGTSSVTNGAGAAGGSNAFGGYGGGQGGRTGSLGTSGAGGGGGAATVVKVGGNTIVAGGAGGGGGSGNGGVLTGRAAESSASSTVGGTSGGSGESVPTSGNQLDGGGAGGGGGGASGGAGGHIEYGSGSTMEWFGYGGYPGANSTGGYAMLSGAYQYYSGNSAGGSVTIKYVDGPPAAARNVIGTGGTAAGTVDLSWDAPVNSGLTAVSGYVVQYSDDAGATWHDATVTSPKVTDAGGSATVTGLTGGTGYVFRVAAVNGYAGNGGQGAYSVPSQSVTVPAGPGALPDSPWGGDGAGTGGTGAENAHVVPGDGTIEIVWDDGTAPDSYTVHVYDEDGHEAGTAPLACAGTQSCVVSGLDPEGEYRVVIETPGAPTAPSEDIAPYQDDSEASNTHPAPGGGTVDRNPDGTITVTPDPMPGDDYLVHVYDDDGEITNSPIQCAQGGPCTTGYLDPGTTYQITIEVPNRSDGAGPVTPSGDQTWTDPQDPPLAQTGAPTNLGVAALDKALSITFTAPTAQPAGNQILYYQYSLDGGTTWANSGAFASPATLSNLTNGTAYSVRLRAMTLQGPGAASVTASGTPRSYPSAPYSGSNPAGISVEKSGSTVTVTWAPYNANGSAITNYTVTAFNAASAGTAVKTCSVGGSTYTCQLTGVTGTVYLSVQAQNGVGASPRSDPRIVLDMSATAPGAPGKPAAGADLTWTTPTGVTGSTAYTVQYSTDGGTTWTTVVPSSGPATSGSTVTAGVASLAGGAGYVFRVRAQNGALVGPWSDPSDPVAVASPLTPAFGPSTSTAGGFTVQVTNYDAALTWAASASPGAATISETGLVTVTGLAASQSGSVTVTASGFGTGSRGASTSGTALGGTAVVLSAATPISDGFTVQIVNWSVYKNGRYGAHTVFTPVVLANPNGVTPSYSGPDANGVITVTGIGDSHQITLAYTVVADGHTAITGEGVIGKSLLAAVTPAFGPVTSTSDGYTVSLTNFDSSGATSYTVMVDQGTVAGPDASGKITVSGLAAGDSATVTVVAQQDGHAIGTGTQSGTALAAGGAPVFDAAVRASGGFTTSVTIPVGYSGATLSVLVSGGATVTCGADSKVNGPVTCTSGQTITVSGVASGKTATVTAYLWDATHGVVSASRTGQALYAGVAPEFGPTYRTEGAFGFPITNWTVFTGSDAVGGTDPNRTAGYRSSQTTVLVRIAGTDAWTACDSAPFNGDLSGLSDMTEPDIRCSTNGEVGVGGLADGQSVTVEVKVSDAATNHTDTAAVRIGAAPTAEELTKLIHLTSTADGFTVDIEGYPASLTTYAVSLLKANDDDDLPAGAAVQCGSAGDSGQTGVDCADAHIIVTGLDPGQSAQVQVSATVPATATDCPEGTDDPACFPSVTATAVTGTALRDDLELALDTVKRASGGFETAITSLTYDATGATAYQIVVTDTSNQPIAGAQVSRNGSIITVSGLADGVQAKVVVTASRDGYLDKTATTTGQAQETGVMPTLGTPARTATGYSVQVVNTAAFNAYDASAKAIVMVSGGASVQCGVSGPARVNGPVECQLADTIIVSGVASGKQATVTVAVSDKDHVETAAQATGQAKFAGVAPEFGEVEREADGFTTSISNWDAFKGSDISNGSDPSRTSNYIATGTQITVAIAGIGGSSPTVQCGTSAVSSVNGTVTCAGNAKITVTGLTSEQQAKVTVTVSEADGNHTDSFAYRQGQALATGVQPTFAEGTSLKNAFSVKIANYDAASSYTITATEGGTGTGAAIPKGRVTFNATTHVITVSGLDDGAQATVRVVVAAAGKLPADASHVGSALKTPVAPVLTVTGNDADGFTVTIANWAAFSEANYGSGTTFTVTPTPQSGDTAPTVSGPDANGVITVTGVPTGHTAGLTVTVKQAEHPDAVSDAVTGTALYAGVAPELGAVTRTSDGFTVPIVNYTLFTPEGAPTVDGDDASKFGADGQFSLRVTAVSPGGTALGSVLAVVLQPDGIVKVSGLAYGQTATIEVTGGDGLTRHQNATAPGLTGQALFGAVPISFGSVTQTVDGFTVSLTGRDGDATYTVTSSAGSASLSGGTITVTGLKPGESASVTVSVSKAGHVSGSAGTSGSALKAGTAPGSGTPVQREDGFTAKINPFDKDAGYTAAVSGAPGATVSVSGDTVTVHGMKPGETVTVTITTSKPGFAPVTTTITYTLPQNEGDEQDPSGGATPPAGGELRPGQAAVTVNGVPVLSQTTVGPAGITVTWQGMTMTAVRIDDGRPVPPGAGGTPDDMLTVPFTGYVKVDVSGFAPGSRVQLWAFSTPTLLGTFTAQPDSSGLITVRLPMAVIVGDHTLVAVGINRSGAHVAMSTAMRVTPLPDATAANPEETTGREEIAYTGTNTLDELRIAAGLLVVGMGLIGLTYRRRRPDPALAQVGVAGGFGPEPESAGPVVVAYGTWKRTVPAGEGAAASAVSAAMSSMGDVAFGSSVALAGAGSASGAAPAEVVAADAAIPAQRTATEAAPVGSAPAAAATTAEPAHRFIAPRREPSLEWLSLRFSLGLTQG